MLENKCLAALYDALKWNESLLIMNARHSFQQEVQRGFHRYLRTVFLTGCARKGFVVVSVRDGGAKNIHQPFLKLLSNRLHILVTSSWLQQKGANLPPAPKSSTVCPPHQPNPAFPTALLEESITAKSSPHLPRWSTNFPARAAWPKRSAHAWASRGPGFLSQPPLRRQTKSLLDCQASLSSLLRLYPDHLSDTIIWFKV